jgi:hypothetical protein
MPDNRSFYYLLFPFLYSYKAFQLLFLFLLILLYLIGSYFLIDKLDRLIRDYFSEEGWLIFYTDDGTLTSIILMSACAVASIAVTVIAVIKSKK